jgi:hypothetical protein
VLQCSKGPCPTHDRDGMPTHCRVSCPRRIAGHELPHEPTIKHVATLLSVAVRLASPKHHPAHPEGTWSPRRCTALAAWHTYGRDGGGGGINHLALVRREDQLVQIKQQHRNEAMRGNSLDGGGEGRGLEHACQPVQASGIGKARGILGTLGHDGLQGPEHGEQRRCPGGLSQVPPFLNEGRDTCPSHSPAPPGQEGQPLDDRQSQAAFPLPFRGSRCGLLLALEVMPLAFHDRHRRRCWCWCPNERDD